MVVEEQEDTILPIETTSRMWNCVMRNVERTTTGPVRVSMIFSLFLRFAASAYFNVDVLKNLRN